MMRFYRVDRPAVYDCEEMLLWFIENPDRERENSWNDWEIYDGDGLYLLDLYAWWGRWQINDENVELVGQRWGYKPERFTKDVYGRVRAFRNTLYYVHIRDQVLDSYEREIQDLYSEHRDLRDLQQWNPYRGHI